MHWETSWSRRPCSKCFDPRTPDARSTTTGESGRRSFRTQAIFSTSRGAFLGSPFGASAERAKGYDLVINLEDAAYAKAFSALTGSRFVCGPCLSPDARGDLPFEDDPRGRLWADKDWIAEDLPGRYPFLRSGFIGEIFCRLAHLEGPIPPYRVPLVEPPVEVPDVLIATAASLPEKLWPPRAMVGSGDLAASRRSSGGFAGAKPQAQRKYWKGTLEKRSWWRPGW